MSEQKRIRGMYPSDAKGMVFTELHEDHELTPEGFQGILTTILEIRQEKTGVQ